MNSLIKSVNKSSLIVLPLFKAVLNWFKRSFNSTDSCNGVTRLSIFWFIICFDSSFKASEAAVTSALLWSTYLNESSQISSASSLVSQIFHEFPKIATLLGSDCCIGFRTIPWILFGSTPGCKNVLYPPIIKCFLELSVQGQLIHIYGPRPTLLVKVVVKLFETSPQTRPPVITIWTFSGKFV